MVYFIYDTVNFYQLQISSVCTDNITIIKNIAEIRNLDTTISNFLLKQNINIFNMNNSFYNDICFHFESEKGKDIALKDRLLLYYPNVTICDDDCKNTGINLTSMTSLCECKTKDFAKNELLDKLTDYKIIEVLVNSNLNILSCYKNLFNFNLWKKNYGGFIILSIILIQIICTLLFIFKGLSNFKIFVSSIIKKLKTNKNITKRKSVASLYSSKHQTSLSKSNISLLKAKNPPKNKKGISNLKIFNDASSNVLIKQNYRSTLRLSNRKIEKANSKKNIKRSGSIIFKSKNNFLENERNKEKNKNKEIKDNKKNDKNKIISKIKSSENKTKIEVNDIIAESIDDMDYNTALMKDNRSWCRMFLDKIIDSLLIINIFYYNNIVPRSLRLILLILKLDIYYVINALFYNETYVSNLFHSTEKEEFFSFISRSVGRIVYTTLASTVITFFIDCFFPDETSLRSLLINSKDNIKKLTNDLDVFYTKTKVNYLVFIFTGYIITLFSWYYISCFNNVYQNTKYEWIKSSVFITILMQILRVMKCYFYALLRYLGIGCKIERFFKLSKKLN